MAKSPQAGRVKTRLCPPCTFEEAALVAEAALADTLEAVAGSGADRKVIALEGPPGPWLPPGFEILPQRGGSLPARLSHGWADLGPAVDGWGIQIGMDTPQVTAGLLNRCLAERGPRRALLGPAVDGGWWLIGLPTPAPDAVFAGIETSRSDTGAAQARRLRALGYSLQQAPMLRDIDTIDDLATVATAIPSSRTAAVAAAITGAARVVA
ncbi:MAG: DUF2064 domain-containing protein [Acidimicrobiales bacterium]